MTLQNMRGDERKNHRIATYLSESENTQIRNDFDQSDFINFSQYHRHLITKVISETESISTIPSVNEVTSYALNETVQAICRFLIQLEKIELSGNSPQTSELINTINGNILYVGDVCYRWAKWYRSDTKRRQVIKDIAELTLSSSELYTLAKAVEKSEEAL
jgi:hypothetical protein